MKKGSIISIIGGIVIIFGLLPLFLYGDLLPNIFVTLLGIILIFMGVFNNKGYYNKNYYIANFCLIALWGLMLIYIFLFRTNEYLGYIDMFHTQIALFIFLMIIFGKGYIRRRKEDNL